MATFLFNEIVFGPVQSRRLGTSLGVNLLPLDSKLCNFNCLYCECGFTNKLHENDQGMPTREEVHSKLQKTLLSYKSRGKVIDTITFAGNGEPTLHPSFADIIEDTLRLRNELLPSAKIAVLSNASLITRNDVRSALLKVDYNILKFDSSNEETIRKINCPTGNFSVDKLIQNLNEFTDNLIIQTLFIKGNYSGFYFDNTSEAEIKGWLSVIEKLHPKFVMVYTIDRDTPVKSLEKISQSELKKIAEKVEQLGIPVSVSG
jgi:wyosine [tRNA(Phe)-imidazoG37] synthetase (radical SAM superfamily)